MKLRSLLLTALFIASGSILIAQSDSAKLAVNVHFGNMDYSGDYATDFYSFNHGIAGGVGASLYMIPSFDLQLDLNLGKVKGNNEGTYRNTGLPEGLYFSARMANVNLNLKYKFTNGYILKESARLSPYLLAGIGGIYSVSEGLGQMGIFEGETSEKVLAFNWNVGAGIKYQMNQHVGLYLQSMQLMPQNDHFDGWYLVIPANKKNDVFLMNCIGVIITPGDGRKSDDQKLKDLEKQQEKERKALEKKQQKELKQAKK